MRYSLIIPTYNRAASLRSTLDSIMKLSFPDQTEVIVVDNNSDDDTKGVVTSEAPAFPVPLRYVFEAEQGRSAALNAGVAASSGDYILVTDDDVQVDPSWIEAAARSFEHWPCDYLGGKVLPIWEEQRPSWLPNRPGKHWAVIGLLDYGEEAFPLDTRVPIGVNMAFRRSAFESAGLWNNDVGRRGATLLGQEVREWGLRAKRAGLIGFYVPDMVVHHVIPRNRLTKKYFRKWFYWHGISRAILFKDHNVDMESPEETMLDFSKIPQIAGVPRYMYRSCLRMLKAATVTTLRRDRIASFENELWVWFFIGILRQRWRDTHRPQSASAMQPKCD